VSTARLVAVLAVVASICMATLAITSSTGSPPMPDTAPSSVSPAPSAHPAELRVVTFNMLHGGPWSEWNGDDQELERRFEIVGAELERLKPDIVGLQEASVGLRRGNVAERLAKRLSLHHVNASATSRVFGGGLLGWIAVTIVRFAEGPAILSRFPIVDSEVIDLPRCRTWYNPRVVLAATLRTPHGDLRAYSTHMSRDDCQVERAAEIVRERRNGLPSLLMGDFNTGETMHPLARLAEHGFIDIYRHANPDDVGATVWQPVFSPTSNVSRRVDYILMLPGHEFGARIVASQVVLKTPATLPDGRTLWPSDHHGVLATLTLDPAARPQGTAPSASR
jgi:endonuclease/exonuclease/phosphatase family metal-dependent hydrolase